MVIFNKQHGIHSYILVKLFISADIGEHACYVGYVWALKPKLAIVIIHQYMQKITNLTRIYHRTGSWNLHNLDIGSIYFELPYNRQLWMFLFQIWHAYVNLSPAYLELLHMFIHQLDREIWTKNVECTLFLGHPVYLQKLKIHVLKYLYRIKMSE